MIARQPGGTVMKDKDEKHPLKNTPLKKEPPPFKHGPLPEPKGPFAKKPAPQK